MGNFNGGSTIIKGGRFASYDPAENHGSYTGRKKPSSDKQTKTSKQQPSKAKKPKDPRRLLESARKRLLHIIIDQILMGCDEIKISRTTHPDLQAALHAAGTPLAWASSQKEFDALQAKKRKQREERELRNKHRQQTTSVTVEVKRKKPVTTVPRPAPVPKPIITAEDIYKANRTSLIRILAGQIIKKQGALTVPKLESRLFTELKASGSPLLWLQAQPDYEAIFKACYLALQEAKAPAPKKSQKLSRKKKKTNKQKLVTGGFQPQSKTAQGKPKKKRVRQYSDPYEKPSRPVKPLSDAPVRYILKQLDKVSEDTLNPRKIDWDVT